VSGETHPRPASFSSKEEEDHATEPWLNRTESSRQERIPRCVEAALLTIGLTLLAVFLAFRIHGEVGSRVAVWQFARLAGQTSEGGAVRAQARSQAVDFGLWSDKRVEAYKQSLAAKFGAPIALLTVERLSLQAPVFEGTDERVLNRGVGRIIKTAKPGEAGNISIAGHRDGFFRCLKDIQIGDRIELATPERRVTYIVDEIRIVNPDDVSVLLPRGRPALTLVTCYPFYFIGSAPRRFIVHASIRESDRNVRVNATGAQVRTNNQQLTNKQEVMR